MSEQLFGNPDQNAQTIPVADQAPAAVVPAVTPVPVDPNSVFANQLATIVSDDGRQKYGDVPTALASIPHAQMHIQQQTARIAELEEAVAKAKGADELMERLASTQSTQQAAELPSVAGLDETNVVEILESHLENKARITRAQTNGEQVREAISAKYGDKSRDQFANKAQELGMSVEELTALAQTSPLATMKLFEVVPVRNPQPMVATSNIAPSTVASTQPDYMARFSGTNSELPSKWAAAKASADAQLNNGE